jgi:hypothetical protein
MISFFDNHTDELSHIISYIPEDGLFAFALTCRAARKAIEKPLKTTYKSLVASLSLVKWALALNVSAEELDYAASTKATCIDVLDHLIRNGFKLPFICANSAFVGNIEILQWARINGCKWDSFTCESAAQGGQLDTLKWARKNGCPWDKHTCSSAAANGNFAILQWAR